MKKQMASSFGVVMLLLTLVVGMGRGEEEAGPRAVWRICRQEMGGCTSQQDCAFRCAAAHPGGQGACKYPPPIDGNHCLCKFPC